MKKPWWTGWLTAVFLAFALDEVRAEAAGFNFSQLTSATNAAVGSILKTIAIGADHRPYAGARSLGYKVGLEIGLDATLITIPQEFTDALTLMGNASTFPAALPLPKLSLRKGLPWRLDTGFTYIGYQNYKIWGADLQWQGVTETVWRPSMALRGSINSASLDVVETSAQSLDFIVSKNLFVIEPYLGLGWQWASGTLNVPSGGSGLPVDVSSTQNFSGFRYFIGVPLKLWVFRVIGEYSSSGTGVNTAGVKFSLSI